MFRKMRREKQAVSKEICEEILKQEKRGVLSVLGDEGYPYGVPMNFYYEQEEQAIYFHGAKTGHKIDAIRRCNQACFTLWQQGEKKKEDWAYQVTGVIAFGHAELVSDFELTTQKVRKMALKYYPTEEEADQEIRAAIQHVQLIRFSITHLTGKVIVEK